MRKGTIKSKLIASLFVIACVLAALSGAACGKSEPTETLEIEVVSAAFRDELVITQEYDAETLIEKKEGVTYSIKSLFYMNADFERVDIPHSGMKFTQNEPYNVTIVIRGESATEYGEVSIELKIAYLTNAVERALVSSWNDEGVVKTYTASEQYRTGGAATAVKVRYNGDYNPINDGVNFGSFIGGKEAFTYTNSGNAVISFDVYNANDFELVFGLQHTADKQNYGINMNVSVPAGQWTKVCWSLHALGYDADAMLDRGGFGLKVRVADDTINAPYDYMFYVCNPDVADYTAEKFPGLETRTPEEIAQERYDSLEGDDVDRKLVGFAPGTANYDVTTDTAVKNSGESSIKATFTRNKLHTFTTEYRGTIINDQKGVLSSVYKPADIDWNKAFLGVWFKHSAESKGKRLSLKLCFANTQDGSTYRGDEYFEYASYDNNRDVADVDDWQYIEWDLSDFGIATGGVTDYKFCLCAEAILPNNGDSATFYLDDIKVFNGIKPAAPEKAIHDGWSNDGVTKSYTDDPDFIRGSAPASVKVEYSGTHNPISDGVSYGSFFGATEAFTCTNKDNAVITFDVYNPNEFDLSFGLLDTNIWKYYGVTAPAGQWTKVCWSLHAIGYTAEDLAVVSPALQIKVRKPSAGPLDQCDYTFYVCNAEVADYSAEKFPGLETRTPDEIRDDLYNSLGGDELERKLAVYATHTPNYAVTTDTTDKCASVTGSTSSIKATFTNDGVVYSGNTLRGTIICDENGILSKVNVPANIDWKHAFFGVWVKGSAAGGLNLCFANTADGTTWHGSPSMKFDSYKDPSGKISNFDFGTSWIYLEWDLSRYNLETENVTDYKFCLCTEIGSSVGDVKIVWIDGITVFSKDEKDILTSSHTPNYAAEIDTATVREGSDYSLKYTFTKGETGYPDGRVARGTFLCDTSGDLFGYDSVNKVEKWSDKIYIGFWLKNTTGQNIDLGVRFANTQDGTNYKGYKGTYEMDSYNMRFWCDGTVTDWVYKEMCLSDTYMSNDGSEVVHDPIYTENVNGWKLALATEMGGTGGTFYISGLKVFSKGVKDILTSSHTPNYAAEIDTATVHEGSDYSIKYTFTKGETGYTIPSRGTFLIDTAGVLFDYKEVNKVTDWAQDVYIGFWLKDTTASGFNMAVRFANTQDGVTYKGWKYEFEMGSYQMAPNINVTGEWQYFEYSLSQVIADVYDGIYTENVTGWKLALATEIGGAGGTFYVSGLSIYNK